MPPQPSLSSLLGRATGCISRVLHGQPGASTSGESRSDCSDAMPYRSPPSAPGTPNPLRMLLPYGAELEERFEKFVSELDVGAENREVLLALDEEKKRQILSEELHRQQRGLGEDGAEEYITLLSRLSKEGVKNETTALQRLEGLKVALRTKQSSFVNSFLGRGGLELLLTALANARACEPLRPAVLLVMLGCFRSILNNTHGRSYVLGHSSAIITVAETLLVAPPRVKTVTLEILGAIALMPGGHKLVLDIMTTLKYSHGERCRFQHLMFDLGRNFSSTREAIGLKTAILSFINALLRSGEAMTSRTFRMHLRYEFLSLGAQMIIDDLREGKANPTLENHMDLFEMMRQEDEEALAAEFEEETVPGTDPNDVSACLLKRLEASDARPHLNSLLNHLLLLPGGKTGSTYWSLIDRITQQVCLQLESGEDPDLAVLELDLKGSLTQCEYEKEIDRMNDEIDTLRQRLSLAETRSLVAAKTGRRPGDAGDCHSISSGVESEASDELAMISPGQGSPDASLKNTPGTLRPSVLSSLAAIKPPPMPAPPLPKFGSTTPPRRLKVPKPSKPMRTFNWSKIPDNQLEGTIWAEMEDHYELYKVMDLSQLEQHFSAIARQQSQGAADDLESCIGTIRRPGHVRPQLSVFLQVIDPRRAQNIQITLSKFKLRNSDVIHAVTTMDAQEIMSKDILEQLLKFLPTLDEQSVLKDYKDQAHMLARPDRFLLEAMKVPHYEQRLRCLYFMKKFPERLADLQPKVEAVAKASRAMMHSKRLKRALEVVLACGNYMNYGKAAKEAGGYALEALGLLESTKSNAQRHYTLMHFLVDLAQEKIPDLLRLRRDLATVCDASKISLADLETDLKLLTSGRSLMKAEMAHWSSSEARSSLTTTTTLTIDTSGDSASTAGNAPAFVLAMKDFLADASPRIDAANSSFGEMKNTFGACAKFFGQTSACPETPLSPDDFFGHVARLIETLAKTYRDVQIVKEEQERKLRTMPRLTLRTRPRLKAAQQGTPLPALPEGPLAFPKSTIIPTGGPKANLAKRQLSNAGDFDQLVLALQSGELFTDELKRLRCSFRGQSQQKRRAANAQARAAAKHVQRIEITSNCRER